MRKPGFREVRHDPVMTRDPATRLLRLLAPLQSRTDWTGTALAERLGVTTGTVRADVVRLREPGTVAGSVRSSSSPASWSSTP
jgi:DeoR/GlpR family transcriptional regulator of sugar metabolism